MVGKLIEQEGRFYKECGVVILATDSLSNIHYNKVRYPKEIKYELSFHEDLSKCKNDGLCSGNRHLYITSDDEIKDGDWYYQNNPYGSVIDRCDDKSPFVAKSSRYIWENGGKKIIATTDTSLGLPQPSYKFIQAYIEAYNKGEEIEKVLVEYSEYEIPGKPMGRKRYVLRVNPKDNNIIIKKVKDSWSRDEIISEINKYMADMRPNSDFFQKYGDITGGLPALHDKWIEENL